MRTPRLGATREIITNRHLFPRDVSAGRRQWLRTALAATGLAVQAGSAQADSRARGAPGRFPERPIQLIVPWTAGGPTDFTLRELGRAAARVFGVPIVVENRPGAGGAIAVNTLLAQPADGYTVMQLPITLYRLPYQQKVAWDPAVVLEPLIQVSEVSFGIYVDAEGPIDSFDALLAFGRREPGKLIVGSTGAYSTPHLVMADLLGKAGIDYVHVPFKGAIDQVYAVQSRTITVGVSSSSFAPFVDSGKLRLLATLDAKRSARWPSVPTLLELGHDIVATSPYGLAVLSGTPPEVVAKLNEGFAVAVREPEHLAALQRYDQSLAYLDATQFRQALAKIIDQEKRWSPLMGVRN